MAEQAEQPLQSYKEEIRKMQEPACSYSQRIIDDYQKLSSELESKIHDLDSVSKHLDELASQSIPHTRNNEQEKNEIMQKEKQVALLFDMLEQERNAKQKLELENKQLQSKSEAMEHMQGDEDSESKNKMAERIQDLLDQCEDMESCRQASIIRERKANDELQLAWKALIRGFQDLTTGRTSIGIKRMGMLDQESLEKAFQQKLSEHDAALFCAKWEAEIGNPDWRPFKFMMVDGKEMEILPMRTTRSFRF
ncbi:hypothetical protein ACQJBY_030065 [Aegilops geniculata]